MSKPLYQSDKSYRRTLLELNSRVEAGVSLKYYDSFPPPTLLRCLVSVCC